MEEIKILPQYATVHIIDTPYHVDRPYSYYIPPDLIGDVERGCFVLVPFGGGNRRVIGITTALLTKEELKKQKIKAEQCKPIDRVLAEEFRVSDEILGLCGFISEMTFCTIGDAAKAAVPVGTLRRLVDVYEGVPSTADAFEERYDTMPTLQRDIWEYACLHKSISRDRIVKLFGKDALVIARQLAKQGFLKKTSRLAGSDNAVYAAYYRILLPRETLAAVGEGRAEMKRVCGIRGKTEPYEKLCAVLAAEEENAEIEEAALLAEGVTQTVLKGAVKYGILEKREQLRYRNPYAQAAKDVTPDTTVLNEEQEQARKTLVDLYRTGEPKAALLHGVTGSGKTRVIKAVMDSVIADGRQVIMLVPEISLTPQSVSIFCAYYGNRVAVVHSGLSQGERLDVWRRVKDHDVDLVIGTRSAVFAPFDNLGLIVIDEEQEHTYKSDTAPKYHARDVARYRCTAHKALLLMASATPSFESYYKARAGIFTLVELTNRYGGAVLPEVVMADLHMDGDVTGETPLSGEMAAALGETTLRGEQSILFVNRRGYRKYLACLSCRSPIMCPRCSVPLTMHQERREQNAVLRCHYCGIRVNPPGMCPSCGSEHLKAFGYGTQRAEQEIGEKLPGVRTLRMDMDTTQGKFAHEEILNRFRSREADVLLGTQMVAKGHDFPDVTLVGVLGADAMLFQDDYRASERTFSLITQVIGRAGRGKKRGRAIIQTYDPNNEILRFAAKQDYKAFYESAIGMRRALIFPPFCDIVAIGVSGEEEHEVLTLCTKMHARLTKLQEGDYVDVPMLVFGPFEAQIYRLNDRYRMRMIIKCRLNKRARALFRLLMTEFSALSGGRVALSIDVNPTNL